MSGPPFPLFRRAGNLKNTNNEKVFHKVLQIIIYFAQRGLLALTIEIGRGTGARIHTMGRRRMYTVRDALRVVLPGWEMSVKIALAPKVMLAQAGQHLIPIGAVSYTHLTLPTKRIV